MPEPQDDLENLVEESHPQESPQIDTEQAPTNPKEAPNPQENQGYPIEIFVAEYCKKIVTYPQVLQVQVRLIEPGVKEVCIHANPLDMGRVIGKDGKMVSALKAFISGVKAKDGFSYKIVVVAAKNPYVL
ncbi:KH domain RNA binding protein [Helicobacter sp. NHP19-012]|uniref:KH domain RNA binding protein n=1 Tax=Helicobacter gastrofelis TaxID=2849642 RepID=A0ABN6I4H1_9HELI|nr:KH domain RNA binding protein [Helicobacter sp. NHP19-012]GMB95772.1 KH domain RNA binding protein [Helicobacter sp. NHP22-001]